jgi:hypothetical protein
MVAGLPLVWLATRPPVQIRYLLLAIAVGILVWLPYLKFEHGRANSDLKSQFARHSNFYEKETLERAATMAREYGLPSDELKYKEAKPEKPLRSLKTRVLESSDQLALGSVNAMMNVGGNFTGYGWGRILSTVVGIGVLLFALIQMCPYIRNLRPDKMDGRIALWVAAFQASRWVTWAGVGMILIACLANEWLVARVLSADGCIENYTIRPLRLFEVLMAVGGMALIARKPIGRALGRLAEMPLTPLGAVAFIAAPCWVLMLWMASPDQPYRFWCLWPLQVVLIMGIGKLLLNAVVARMSAQNGTGRQMAAQATAVLGMVIMTLNPAVFTRVQEWRAHGWEGDSREIRALDTFGTVLSENRENSVAIGYVMPYQPFMAYFQVLDPIYKIGLQYDWYLLRKHGIRNSNTSPAGISRVDRYRLVIERDSLPNEVPALQVSFSGWEIIGKEEAYSWWRIRP